MSEWLIDYHHPVDMTKKYYFGWRPAYKNLLTIEKPIAVEVGVLEGFNTNFAIKYINFGKYYLVDPYKKYDTKGDIGELDKHPQEFWDDLYLRTRERFKDKPNLEFIRKTSKEASKCFLDNSLDFVYIDADHSYDCVWEDLNLWFPKVKVGGWLAGHDISHIYVSSAVYKFFLYKYGDNISREFVENTVDTGYNDWWIKKI